MRKIQAILILLLSLAGASLPARAEGKYGLILAEVEKYALKVAGEWKIPGMSMAIIKGDSVIFCKGFGIKNLDRPKDRFGPEEEVTGKTMFHAGSMTKAFTATVIASLADEGLLSWEDTVKNILPDFEWADDSIGSIMQVKDLLTHTTGLAAQAGTYIPNIGYGRDDIYAMLKYIRPLYPFREKFAYNNITFIIAAKVIEKVSGMSWEENVRQRIMVPLGMSSSSPDMESYIKAGDSACSGHYFGYGKDSGGNPGIKVFPFYGEDRALHWINVMAPAGGISTNAEDMARWVMFHMNNGCTDSVRLISEREMSRMHGRAVTVSEGPTTGKYYGYCWYIEDNGEYSTIYHTGTTWGFTGICGFVPEIDLGMVILCNSEVSEYARKALMKRITDLFINPQADPDSLSDPSREGLLQWFSERGKTRKRVAVTPVKRSSAIPEPEAVTGVYRKDWPFGDAVVSAENGKLYLEIGRYGWKHRLKHHRGNEFWLTSGGHTYAVFFNNYTEGDAGSVEMVIDFNYNEDFGPWLLLPSP